MPIRIHHLSGSKKGETRTFGDQSFTLGRRSGNDVEFDPELDRTVSGNHAEVVLEGSRWFFRDKGSSGGSWMRGARIDRIELHGGEEIELGRGGPVVRFDTEAHAAATVAPAAVSGGPVGSKTVGMMIQEAFAKARDAHTGRVATISFVRSVAGEAVRHGSRRFKIVLACIFLVLFGAVVFLIWELYRTRAELQEINLSKLGPSEIGEWIADQNKAAIFLLLYRTGTGFEQGFCTGFAVNHAQLLTNAHCVMQMQKLAAEGSVLYAAQNEGMGGRRRITRWSAHSGYVAGSAVPTADVGVVDVEGRLERFVSLAETEQVKLLKSGSQIFVFGFPGDLSNVGSPVATITNGVIGRLTALDGQAAAPDGQYLLQYSAFTSKGTSGSPVFDKYGRVIAVNSGYYQGKSRVVIENPMTGKSEDANVSRDLSGYAFGIRIDLAHEVFR